MTTKDRYLNLQKHLCNLPNFDQFLPLRGTRFIQIDNKSFLENGAMKMPAEDTTREEFIQYIKNGNFQRAKECYLVYQAFCENINEEICFLAIPSFIHNVDKENNHYQLKPDVSKSILFNTKFLEHESKAKPERVLGSEQRYMDFNDKESPPITDDWAVWHKYAITLSHHVTSFPIYSFAEALKESTGETFKIYASLYKANGAGDKTLNNILDLYDDLIVRGEQGYKETPLAQAIHTHDNALKPTIQNEDTLVQDILSGPFFLGHMDEQKGSALKSLSDRSLFPLDNSQRLALSKICKMPDGQSLAVNGPPGSGKTAMLKAVIAHHWVSAALNKLPCPIIVAVGATNQSVTNIIDAFPKSLFNANDIPSNLLHFKRWIGASPHSYGTFFPSKTKSDELKTDNKLDKYVIAKECAPSEPNVFQWLDNCKHLSEIDQLKQFTKCYIENAETCFGKKLLLHEVVEECHANLVSLTKNINEKIENSRSLNLKQFEENLDRFISIPKGSDSGNNRKEATDIAEKIRSLFDPQIDIRTEQRKIIVAEVLRERIQDNCIHIDNLEGSAFSKMLEDTIHILIDQLLDVTLRADAFHWAARYWEGVFLSESRNSLLIVRSEKNVEEGLRRLCMLTPCLVSTLHSAPKLFSLEKSHPNSPRRFLLGKAELMIMDESGQAQQRLGMPLLSLCKKLLVVGDVDQLQPVITDVSLAEEANAYSLFGYTKFQFARAYENKQTTVNGSMLSTLRLSSYVSYQDYGLMLRGHYRCQSNIIQFCNEMVYKNKLMLLPSFLKERGPLPSLSWIDSNFQNGRDGSSRFSLKEAEQIAIFLYSQWERLYNFYKLQNEIKNIPVFSAPALIAIVTPFKAQVQCLRNAMMDIVTKKGEKAGLTKFDIDSIIIGTVDSIQGAEMPIVIFSGVHGSKENAEPYFKDQPFLLNVAVSRAKDCFVAFVCEETYGINAEHKNRNLESLKDDSVKYFGYYLGAATFPNGQRRCVRLFPKRLVIIEAPGKEKTISEYLGPEYEIKCTNGSITEVISENITIDNLIQSNFKLRYTLKSNGQQIIEEIRRNACNFNEIILATDDDYVGESIAWHVYMQFKNVPEIQRKMTRVRLRAINFQEIQRAFDTQASLEFDQKMRTLSVEDATKFETVYLNLRGKIDRQLVKAELFRELVDTIIRIQCRTELKDAPNLENETRVLTSLLGIKATEGNKMVVGMGRVRLGILHILISELEQRATRKRSSMMQPRIIASHSTIDGVLDSTEPVDKTEMIGIMRQRLSISDGHFVVGKAGKWKLISTEHKELSKPAPTGATIEVIKLAYHALGFSPEKTTNILQALYEGNF